MDGVERLRNQISALIVMLMSSSIQPTVPRRVSKIRPAQNHCSEYQLSMACHR